VEPAQDAGITQAHAGSCIVVLSKYAVPIAYQAQLDEVGILLPKLESPSRTLGPTPGTDVPTSHYVAG
jgi:hypothetical protein